MSSVKKLSHPIVFGLYERYGAFCQVTCLRMTDIKMKDPCEE